MIYKPDSIKSLLSNKIIPLPANSYIAWGVITIVMTSFSMSTDDYLDTLLVLLVGSLFGVIFTWWDISRINALFHIFSFSTYQRDLIVVLISFLMFALILTAVFIKENIPVYINPVWFFAIGGFQYIIGSYFNKYLLLSYGVFLIFASFVAFVGIMYDEGGESITRNSLSVASIIILGVGNIAIGIYYKLAQKVSNAR